MSEKTLVQHMSEIMAIVGYIQKDATNSFQNYTYASAQAVFDKVRKELSERGIAIGGDVELVASEIVGPKLKHLVVAKHTLEFTDGKDTISVSALGEGIDSGDKASMKSDTAGVKYCLAKAFLISWGDDDPDAYGNDDGVDQDKIDAIEKWLGKCEKASIEDVANYKDWWGKNGSDVKSDCGEVGAVEIYKLFSTFHKRLKDEAAG